MHSSFELLHADSELFFQGLASAKVSSGVVDDKDHSESVITLLNGAVWPDMEPSPDLFVRHFYAPCWESVMSNGTSTKKFVVLGTRTCTWVKESVVVTQECLQLYCG